jgi:hypothetical protein
MEAKKRQRANFTTNAVSNPDLLKSKPAQTSLFDSSVIMNIGNV